MTVYVDQLFQAKGRRWCHMVTDQADLTELHEMAKRIGLKRCWFQANASHPHYDLTESMRRKAVAAGAVECDSRKAVEIIQERRALINQKGAFNV